MSWLTLALGLIREAATTDVGQEILKDVRSGVAGGQKQPEPAPAEPETNAWRQSVESRLALTDRNTEMLVRMLNAQDEAMVQIQKRQRIWNLSLAGAIALLALGLAWLWFAA